MIAVLLPITISVLFLGLYIKNLRKKMIYVFLERNIVAYASSQNWYSTTQVQLLAKKLNKLPKKRLHPIFNDIKKQNFSSLIKFSESDDIKVICRKKSMPTDIIGKAEIAIHNFKFATCSKLLEQITPKNLKDKARVSALEAAILLHEGDLETASIKINSAINKFKKLKMKFEEAQAYQLYGIIYKACALNDPAQIMFQTAIDLFEDIGAKAKQAEVLGNLGMLMIQQDRYLEAMNYFDLALNLFINVKNKKGIVDIYNQKAIAELTNSNLSAAQDYSYKALLTMPAKYTRGKALNTDINAQIAASKNNWKKVQKLTSEAMELYKKDNNASAMLEMMHLQAQAMINLDDFSNAEKLLRVIIKIASSKRTCFHIANAYNLLGVIYLQQKDFVRAKGLFNQALTSELCNERWYGAAIDYANLSLADYRCGKNLEALKNKETALKYAEESGDKELLQKLAQKLNLF